MADLQDHRKALEGYFRDRPTIPGVIARRVLGRPGPEDAELADHFIRQRRRRSSLDGSIDHALVPTARALAELLDLGAPADHAAVTRLSGFILGRQDAPGRWGEADGRGAGFFSPGTIDTPIAPLVTRAGTVYEDENDARFAASVIALRQALRAGHEARNGVRTHLEGLLAIGPTGMSASLAGIVLTAIATGSPDMRERAVGWIDRVTEATDISPAHLFASLTPVPSATARAIVADRLTDLTPVADDTPEDVALLYARAAGAAGMIR